MEQYRFFDSIDGEDERYYTADEFAEYFRQFIRNGIFTGGENLRVGTNEQDMKTFIRPGYAWIEGYLYKIDKEPLYLQHSIADPALNRIDRVVIRLDKTLEHRFVKAFILKGEAAEEPVAPEITRNENIYEISLAQVEIKAGKSFIEESQITDERLNHHLCGVVTHLFTQVDTSQVFQQWQDWYRQKTTLYQEDWAEWVATTQPQLIARFNDWFESVMADTGVDVDAFTQAFTAWFNGIKEQYNAWFNGIEGGTYITYEKLGTGLATAPDGTINVTVDTNITDTENSKKYRWGIENGLIFLEEVWW